MASNSYSETHCGHNSSRAGKLIVHTLPCRHKICLECLEAIEGLMEGQVFSCPLCQNCSQYVRPHEEVYGIVENRQTHADERHMPGNEEDHRYVSNLPHQVMSSHHQQFSHDTSISEKVVDEIFFNRKGSCDDHGSEKAVSNYSESKVECTSRGGSTNQSPSWHDNFPRTEAGDNDLSTGKSSYPTTSWNDQGSSGDISDVPINNNPSSSTAHIQLNTSTESLKNQAIYHATIMGKASHDPNVRTNGATAHSTEHRPMSIEGSPERGELIHQKFSKDGHKATYCNQHSKPVYFFCSKCNEMICASCKEDKHKQHEVIVIDETPFNTIDGIKVQQHIGGMQPTKAEQHVTCNLHRRPCMMICLKKLEFICRECHEGYHCIDGYFKHYPLKTAGDNLTSRGKAFGRKLTELEERMTSYTYMGQTNLNALVENTESLTNKINEVTKRAIAQLEENRKSMIETISKASEEKLKKCTETLESLIPVSEFLQQAGEMNVNFQDEIEKGQYAKALKSFPQVEKMIDEIGHTVAYIKVKEEILGLYLKEDKIISPVKLTTYPSLW